MEKPKDIILKDVPDDIWNRIREMKIRIMQNNKNRVSVSHREAIYKLIKKECGE